MYAYILIMDEKNLDKKLKKYENYKMYV